MSAQIIAQQIADGLGDQWILGSNIFAGMERPAKGDDIPRKAIFVLATGGTRAESQSDGYQIAGVSFQITVRSESDEDWIEGGILAQQVLDLVDMKPPISFIELTSRSARPNNFPPTDQGSFRWIINLDGSIHELQ